MRLNCFQSVTNVYILKSAKLRAGLELVIVMQKIRIEREKLKVACNFPNFLISGIREKIEL